MISVKQTITGDAIHSLESPAKQQAENDSPHGSRDTYQQRRRRPGLWKTIVLGLGAVAGAHARALPQQGGAVRILPGVSPVAPTSGPGHAFPPAFGPTGPRIPPMSGPTGPKVPPASGPTVPQAPSAPSPEGMQTPARNSGHAWRAHRSNSQNLPPWVTKWLAPASAPAGVGGPGLDEALDLEG